MIGKGGKERKFYLSEISAEYLQQYLKSRTDDTPALFVSVKAPFGRLGKEGIEVAVKRLGMKAGVDNVHPHRFRNPNLDKIQTFLWKASELAVPPT